MLPSPDNTGYPSNTLLAAAFGLSPAECRIAAHIANGESIETIAVALGTKPNTVRKQLQAIYQKTSTSRQTELVCLLLRLPGQCSEAFTHSSATQSAISNQQSAMQISRNNHDHLIDLIYKTVENDGAWNDLLAELREMLGFKVLHAFAFDKRYDTLSFSRGSNIPADGALSYLQKYHLIDPRADAIRALPPMEWIHDHEILDDRFVASNEYFQEFLLPLDLRYCSACKVVEDEMLSFMIAGLRSKDQGPLPKEDAEFLSRLLPHIARAARIGINHFIYSRRALVGHALVNRLSQPVILTTTTGKIIHINEAGQHLLDSTMLIAVRNGQLDMPQQLLTHFLHDCAEIERQVKLNGGVDDASHEYKSLQIHAAASTPGTEKLYAFYTALLPQKVMGSFGLRPLIMLMFYHPESVAPVDNTLLAAAFGLSPAECKIATMLTEGYSVAEIAASLEKKEDTIRKQLKSIYEKTSTTRQPELIKLLLNLPTNPELNRKFSDAEQAKIKKI